MDVATVTCAALPEPDFDEAPLARALNAAGLSTATLAWDDPASDWSRGRLTLLRSAWNYPQHPEAFLAWAESTSRVTDLWNPLPFIRWNVHKRYLLALEAAGVAIAPTELVAKGSARPLEEILETRGWTEAVVKPAISAASFRTLRVGRTSLADGEAHLRSLATDGDVLVQRYLPSVEDYGERALIWIEGELTHAVRKSPRFAGEDESVSPQAVGISAREARLVDQAIAALAQMVEARPMYARLDSAPGPDGDPVVMEFEIIEPSLFFPQSERALELFVAAVERRLGR